MGSPPRDLVRRWGDLVVLPERLGGREARLWLAEMGGVRVVLRRLDPARLPPSPAVLEDRRWVHELLDDLVGTGFPAPRPVLDEQGRSLVIYDGAVWELVSYVDGVAVGWHPGAPLHGVGALLARLHDAVDVLPPRPPRPSALPLAHVPPRLRAASAAIADATLGARLGGLADRLSTLLDTAGHAECSSGVIHGDFTAHNVVASPGSLRPVGVIDFGLAHQEATVADVAYGLWRSGRPHQDASWIDADRAAAWVAGYVSVRPLSERDLGAIPVYLVGRGLQMVTKRVIAGRVDELPLQQIDWLLAHQHELADTLARVTEHRL